MGAEQITPLTGKAYWPEIGKVAARTESLINNRDALSKHRPLFEETVHDGVELILEAKDGALVYLTDNNSYPYTSLKKLETYGLVQRSLRDLGVSYDSIEELEVYLNQIKTTLYAVEKGQIQSTDQIEKAASFYGRIKELGVGANIGQRRTS